MTATPPGAVLLVDRLRAALSDARAAPHPFYRLVLTPPGDEAGGEIELTRFFMTDDGDPALAVALHRLALTKLAALGVEAATIERMHVALQPDGDPPGPTPADCQVQAEVARWRAAEAGDRGVREGFDALAEAWARLSERLEPKP